MTVVCAQRMLIRWRWAMRYSGVLDQLRGDASGPAMTMIRWGSQVFMYSWLA
jgi:hypothetical protein